MRRYARFVIPALGLVVILVGFLLFNLKDSLVFFRTPTEVVEEATPGADNRMRLGGQVVGGTIEDTSAGVAFDVSDGVSHPSKSDSVMSSCHSLNSNSRRMARR